MPNDPLSIAAIRHWIVFVPLKKSILWASGRRAGSTRLICEITTAAGVKGYGETICLLDFVPPVFENLVKPLALGRSIADVERLSRHAEGAGYYHHKRALVFALSAVEMAMWDALGKHAGLPLHALWGGLYRERVEMCAYVYIADAAGVAAELAEYQAQGYRSFKLKLGAHPREDVALTATARDAIGADANLRVDLNGAWTPATARRMLEKLKPFDLQYVEQPLPAENLLDLAELRRHSSIPICVDEGAYTLQETMNVIRMDAADVILVDPHESGGLWQCLKTAAVAEASGMHVGMHSGGELGLTQAANLHLAASMPNATIALDSIYLHHADDILAERLVFADGMAEVPRAPGLGVEVDTDKLERYRAERIESAYLDAERPDWFAEKPSY